MEGVGVAMKSGLELVHSKAIIDNQLGLQDSIPAPSITMNGGEIPLHNGYPAVNGRDSFAEVNARMKA